MSKKIENVVVDTNNYKTVSPSGVFTLHSEKLFCKGKVIVESEKRYGFGTLATFSVTGNDPVYRVIAENDDGLCKYMILRFDTEMGDWVYCSLKDRHIRRLMRGTVSEGAFARVLEGLARHGYQAYEPIRRVYEPELLLWQRLAG